MNYGGAIIKDMAALLDLLAPHCGDRETIDRLRTVVTDRGKWHKAHGIFNQVRSKSAKAERSGKSTATAQWQEGLREICAGRYERRSQQGYYAVEDQRFLGAEGFGEEISRAAGEKELPRRKRSIEADFKELAERLNVMPAVLRGRDPR
jgi:hypothetical protein